MAPLIQEMIDLFYNVQKSFTTAFPSMGFGSAFSPWDTFRASAKILNVGVFLAVQIWSLKRMTFIQAFHIHNQFYKDWKLFCRQ